MGFGAAVPHGFQQRDVELSGQRTPGQEGFSSSTPFQILDEAMHQGAAVQPETRTEREEAKLQKLKKFHLSTMISAYTFQLWKQFTLKLNSINVYCIGLAAEILKRQLSQKLCK